jgi:hypothetical protein
MRRPASQMKRCLRKNLLALNLCYLRTQAMELRVRIYLIPYLLPHFINKKVKWRLGRLHIAEEMITIALKERAKRTTGEN